MCFTNGSLETFKLRLFDCQDVFQGRSSEKGWLRRCIMCLARIQQLTAAKDKRVNTIKLNLEAGKGIKTLVGIEPYIPMPCSGQVQCNYGIDRPSVYYMCHFNQAPRLSMIHIQIGVLEAVSNGHVHLYCLKTFPRLHNGVLVPYAERGSWVFTEFLMPPIDGVVSVRQDNV